MEVRKSKARFISIFCIVALGVAFFSGIQATSPDMRHSGDAYYDSANLMDLKVMGTLGLTDEDVEAIRSVDGVEEAWGAYSTDVLCGDESAQKVVHIESIHESVNQITLEEGRIPEKSGECFLDIQYANSEGYEIGDTLTFRQEEDSELLLEDDFTVVGMGSAPLYISTTRGNSTLGSGEVSGFAYVLAEDFDQEVYTQIYIHAHGAKGLTSYTDEYDNLIEKIQKRVDGIEAERCQIRYDEVVTEAREELDEAREELEDAKKEAQEELAEAEQELKDGEKELEEGKEEYEDGKQQLADAKKELEDGKQQFADAKQELEDGKAQLEDAKAEVASGWSQIADAKAQVCDGWSQLKPAKAELASGWEQFHSAQAEIDSGKKEIKAAKAELSSGKKEIAAAKETMEAKQKEVDDGLAQAEAGQAVIEENTKQLTVQKQQCEEGLAAVAAAESQLAEKEPAITQLQALVAQKQAALNSAGAAASEKQNAVNNANAVLAEKQAALNGANAVLNEKQAARNSANAVLAQRQAALANAQAEYEQIKQEVAAGNKTQEEADAAASNVTAAQGAVNEQQSVVNAAQGEVDAANAGVSAAQGEVDAANTSASAAQGELDAANAALAAAQAEYDGYARQLAAAQAELEGARQQIADQRSELESAIAQIEGGLAQIEQEKANLAAAREQLAAGQQAIDDGWAQLQTEEAKLTAGEKQIAESEKKLNEGQETLNASKQELLAGQAEINANEAKLASAQAEINANEQKLASAEAEIASSEQTIADGEREIAENEQTILDGEKEIAENEQKLADAKKEIEDGEKELKDGWKEYEDGKEEAEEEIADAEKEIEDAQKEIDDLDMPEWYVTDRSDLPEYADYGDNADRIRSLGKVFPVIFFLVAALISLTTMTRMVEEQRTQIGTLKALGYDKYDIASKYLNYAFLATVGGSILGFLIGEKLIPYIIIMAYGTVYKSMAFIMKVDYQVEYAVIAALASVFCTVGATFASCYKALAETPAGLMRPPAPKEGKRVLVERITFLWKHLNFSWKSCLRNLFRYKKRLFMTIFGIAGSMGLMLVGYGIRDSVGDISARQFTLLQHYDGIIISDEEATEEEREELNAFLANSDKLDHYTSLQFGIMEAPRDKANLNVYVYVPENLENFPKDVTLQSRTEEESYSLTNEGAVVTEKTCKLLNLEVGDMLTLEKDEKQYQVKIAAITENYMAHYVYMTPEVYAATFGEEPDFADAVFTVKEEYKEETEEIGEEILQYPAALSISYSGSIQATVDRMLDTLGSVIIVLIVSAGLLAFVVLYNLNNINITERQRELATLKVLGFYDGEVSQYVFRENILLTVLGILFGAGFGALLHRYVILTVEVDNIMFGRNISLMSFVYCAVFTAAFSAIINWIMHYKLKKIDMVESLKSVE